RPNSGRSSSAHAPGSRPQKTGPRRGAVRGYSTALGSMLMAAPSGLTRFTLPLCVGPLTAPRRGPEETRAARLSMVCFVIIALLLALRRGRFVAVDDDFADHHRPLRVQAAVVAAVVLGDRLPVNLPRHVQAARHLAEDGLVRVLLGRLTQ